MPSQRPSPRLVRLTRIEKAVFVATLGFGVLLLIVVPMWWRHMEATPQLTFPTAAATSLNALDFYTDAGGMLTDTSEILYAVMSKNGRVTFPIQLDSGKTLTRWPTKEEKLALLKKNEPALHLLRQGFKYRYQSPPFQPTRLQAGGTETLYWTHFRALANLLVLESQLLSVRGDWEGTANSLLDTMRLGTDIRGGGDYSGLFVGISCESIGQRRLPPIIERLNARQARDAARRLEAIRASGPTLAAVLEAQKRYGQAKLIEIFAEPDWREVLFKDLYQNADNNGGPSQLRLERFKIEFISKRGVFQSYTKSIDKLITQSKQPYRGPRSTLVPVNSILSALSADNVNLTFIHARNNAFQALSLLSLALRAYRLERGEYPPTLNDLVPTYLKELPVDAFDLQTGFRYKRDGKKYVMYSIGPDGKDNGGLPASTPINRGTRAYYIDPESQGDIVFGVSK